MNRIALIIGAAALFAGCSTELDINAPYKDITVVYGLLNMRDSVQYVKVNKAYLGDGDAYIYAQIQDSNEWNSNAITNAKVHRVLNGQRVSSFDLVPTPVTDREPGIFYAPNQLLYSFQDTYTRQVLQNGIPVTMHLDEDSDYELELTVKGQTISATTTIVDDFSFQAADQSLEVAVRLVTPAGGLDQFELNWTSNKDGKRYAAEYRFNYKEVRGTDTTDLLSITQGLGKVVSASSSINEPMGLNMDGGQFFSTLASQIPTDPSVDKRIFLGLDFIIYVANDEFHTFLSLGEPVSGIIEDRPSYTNLVNGYGIFAGRYVKRIIGKRLDENTLGELVDGNLTSQLRFCTGIPADSNSPYFCP